MKMKLTNILNLNSYEFWRNHRRFITAGIFLALFGSYIRLPIANDFKVKDTCAKLNSSYQITGAEAIKILKLKSLSDYEDRTLANYYSERYLGLR